MSLTSELQHCNNISASWTKYLEGYVYQDYVYLLTGAVFVQKSKKFLILKGFWVP
jgi:hypothetical protein